jgi:hypothetical protein
LRLFFPMLFDLLAPVFVYYLLHVLGVGDFVALLVGGLVSGANAAVDGLRSRQSKNITMLVFLMFVLSIFMVFLTHDARIILLKPSIFVGAAGLYLLSTTFSTPFLVDSMEPFATEGDPEKITLWRRSWKESAAFRHRLQIATALSGLMLLLEAISRAVIVFTLPVEVSVIASNIPGVGLIVFFALIGRFYLKGAAEQAMGE